MIKPSRRGNRRPPSSQTRALTNLQREQARANAALSPSKRQTGMTVYGLRRLLLNPGEIIESLDLDEHDPMRQAGFGGTMVVEKRRPCVAVLNPSAAVELSKTFDGTSTDFYDKVEIAGKGFPDTLHGHLGNVAVFGRIRTPGFKYVGWNLDDHLTNTLLEEGRDVASRFKSVTSIQVPFLIFLETIDIDEASCWEAALIKATPEHVDVSLGPAKPFHVIPRSTR